MIPECPKGPEREARPLCNCEPCQREAVAKNAPISYLRRQVAELVYDALDDSQRGREVLPIHTKRDVDAAADAVVALVQPELERLTAERDEWRQAAGAEADLLDQAITVVSRLREQLATAVVLPPSAVDDLVEFWHTTTAVEFLDDLARSLLAKWGVSSSEVEAPQPPKMAQHKVRVTKLLGSGQSVAVCPGCRAGMTGADQEAEDWKDQHEADTLRPVLTDDSAKLTDESSISQKDEGRPSATGAATPHWCEGDIAIDQTNFVHRRFEHGWRTWPRESGLQYGDALMESGFGPMLRLDEVPAETDAHGHVPVLVAERVRAAQAARSEATPKSLGRCVICGVPGEEHATPQWCMSDQYVDGSWPSPSLRKEGDGRE